MRIWTSLREKFITDQLKLCLYLYLVSLLKVFLCSCLHVMRHLAGDTGNMPDIAPRQAMRPALVTGGGALPIALLVLPPLLIAILAVAVLTPRRYL